MSSRSARVGLCLWATVVIGGGPLAACSFWERPESHFASASHPGVDELRRQGWLPSIVSPSASDIHEMHDLDTNRVWLSCRLPARELEALKAIGEDVGGHELQIRPPSRFPSGRAPWWPGELSGTVKPAELQARGYLLRRDGSRLVVTHETEGLLYYVSR